MKVRDFFEIILIALVVISVMGSGTTAVVARKLKEIMWDLS